MADTKKHFTKDWAENTVTGKVVDTLTGGAVSAAADRVSKAQRVNRKGKGDYQAPRNERGEAIEASSARSLYGKRKK